jgi:uncharacterized protein (DUF2237 family)
MKNLIRISIILVCFVVSHVKSSELNVLGTELKTCNLVKVTGFHRSGFCQPDENDYGTHLFCSQVDQPFLNYTGNQGNDLQTPRSEYNFPGLVPGDNWCLCVYR